MLPVPQHCGNNSEISISTILPVGRERRSTRLLLSIPVIISGKRPQDGFMFEATADTLVVNKHGALIRTTVNISPGTKVNLAVLPRKQSVRGQVVWITSESGEMKIGVELEPPANLWGVMFPLADWEL